MPYHQANSCRPPTQKGWKGTLLYLLQRTQSWGSRLLWEAQASKTQSFASSANFSQSTKRIRQGRWKTFGTWKTLLLGKKNHYQQEHFFQSGKMFCRIPATFRNGVSPAPSCRREPWNMTPGYDVLSCYLPADKNTNMGVHLFHRKMYTLI